MFLSSFHVQRDVSNREGAQNQNGEAAGKRPRRQKKQKIELADDDEPMHGAPKPRRSSLRLLAKREAEVKTNREAERQRKKEEKVEKARTKRKRQSAARSGATVEPPSKKMRTAWDASNATMRQINREAKSRIVTNIPDEKEYIVHPDFRMQSESFNGKNHTMGIARHDKDDIDDELKNTPYITDMFQHLFAAEVS